MISYESEEIRARRTERKDRPLGQIETPNMIGGHMNINTSGYYEETNTLCTKEEVIRKAYDKTKDFVRSFALRTKRKTSVQKLPWRKKIVKPKKKRSWTKVKILIKTPKAIKH